MAGTGRFRNEVANRGALQIQGSAVAGGHVVDNVTVGLLHLHIDWDKTGQYQLDIWDLDIPDGREHRKDYS